MFIISYSMELVSMTNSTYLLLYPNPFFVPFSLQFESSTFSYKKAFIL